MKNKLRTGIYSNGTEKFKIDLANNENELEFYAITKISYLPLKQGERTLLAKRFVASLIDDNERGFLLTDE